MTRELMRETNCRRCAKFFVRKWTSSRIVCPKCQDELAEQVLRRERKDQMTPAQVEAKLDAMIANETRMPWERVKP